MTRTRSDVLFAQAYQAMFDAQAFARGSDIGKKMAAVSKLQTILEELQKALEAEDEEP
jgi:flagellin-specific chaperone FliS